LSENLSLLWRTINSDFARVSSGDYPTLERFEPIGSARQKRSALLLQRFLLAHPNVGDSSYSVLRYTCYLPVRLRQRKQARHSPHDFLLLGERSNPN